MIAKTARKERMNMSAAAGTAYSVPVYSVSSGRSFILTDIIIEALDSGEGYTIFDGASAASPTAGTEKLRFIGNPVHVTDIENGPEFSTGVTIRSDSGIRACSANVCWVGGFER